MAKKKDKNKDKIWNEYDSVVRNAMWPISPTAYLFGRYLYDKIAGNPTEFNRALYSAVNPAGDQPELSLKGVGNALVDMMFTNAKLLTGDYNNVWYKQNDESIGNRVARAAWAKYNKLPYDESLIIDNGDGTYSLPESVTKKIRTERSEIEGAYKINKEKYDKIREGYRKRITNAIDRGNLEEIPVIQRERDNNDELKILEYAIDFDEHNLKGLESLEKNGYGVFNMFNTKDRNLRKELNTDLNILNDFTIRKNDDGTYSYEDMYDFFPLFHFLSNGKTFKIKGKIKKAGGGEIKTVSEEERPDFLKWYYDVATKKGLSLNPYGRNHYYDYELFWKNEPELAKAMLEGDSDAHFIDKYKMPGHPTFSNESIYSNKDHEGGSWVKHNGVNYFVPSDFTKQYIERTNDYLYGTGEGFVDDRLDGEKKYMLLGVGDETGKRTGTGFRGVPFKNPNMDWDAFTSRFHKMNRFGGGKERRVSTDNLEYLYEKLLEKGYTGNQIYTLMANAIEESGGNPKAGIDSTGYAGLFQESLQRYTQDERDRDSKLSDKEVIDNTVDRIDKHIRKGDGFLYYKGGFDNQKKAQEVFLDDDSSLEDVMRSFVYNFERTADPQGTYINRVNTARIIRDMVESNEKPEILNVPKVIVYNDGGDVPERRPEGKSTVEDLKKYTTKYDFVFPKRAIKYEDGGLNDIRNYYASRDNTAVGAPGYDLNAGRIMPSQDSDLTETVASFTPVIGDIMDLKSLHDSYKKGDKVGMLLSAAALLPVVGGFASKALKYKNASDAAKYVLENAKRDKELIDKFPSYANPNSPINDALGRHKLRLERGAYERLTGEEPHLVGFKNGKPQWGFGDIDFNVYNIRDKKDLKSLSDFYGMTEEEFENKFKDNSDLIFATFDRIIWDPNVLRKFPEDKEYWSRYLGKFDDEGEFGHIISHEVDHMVHYPDKPIGDDDGFDFSWMPDDMRNYFSMDNNAEMSARGSQIKDYFGLTNDKQKITPEMLEYASRHYIDDYGVDNNMYEFFKSIKDYDKAAKWITENASAGLGALWLLDREVLKDNNKKDGGVIRFSKKLNGDSIFVKTSKRKVSAEELDKHTMKNDIIFPKRAIKYEDGGLNDIRNYYASRDNTAVGAPGYDLNVGDIKPSQSFDITETVASFLPGVGDVIDAKDLMESAKDKDVMGMALALAGFIPVAGDAAQEYFRLLRESRGLDRGKRFIRNDIKETDDELLEKMPSYAHPNSPMADAMVFHKMRLDNDGYNKVVGGYTPGLDYRMRDLNQTYPGIYDKAFDVDYVFDPKSKDTRALVGITYGLSDDVVKKMSDDEIMNHVRRLQFKLNANSPMFNIGNKGDRATVYSSSGFERQFPFGGDDALNAAKSHELEHAVRNNAETPVTKEMADEAKEWFSFSSGNDLYDEYMNNPLELLARGSQIKDYFGLTNSKQKVTPEMLKYFSRHYAFDVFDNDMTNFVRGIKDWDKAAKWISEYPTVYGGAAIVSKALEEGDSEVENMEGSSDMESGGVVFPNDDQSMSGNGLYRPLLYPYMISKRKKFIKNLMKLKYGISESDSESLIDNMAKKTLLDSDYYDLKNKEYGIASLKGNDLKEFVSTYKNGGLIDQVDFIAKKLKRGDYRQFMELGGLVEKQDKLLETLTDNYGIPDLQAVAIVANLTHESNLDPYVTGDSGDSYGIQQWRDARRMALWDFARNRYHAVPTYEDQVDFLMNEFNQGKSFQFDDKGKNLYQSGVVKNPTFDYYQYSKNDFMNASNLYDAVIAWNQGAGRPSKKYAMNDRRFEIAKEIAERNGIEYDPVSHYSEMGYRSVGNEDITGLEQAVEENPAAAEVVAETTSVADREEGAPPAGATQKERENWLISHYEDAILQQSISSDGLRNKMDRMDKEISALKDQIESEEQKESEAIKESEQKRREREFLASVLSNVQLNIKGVSQIGRG